MLLLQLFHPCVREEFSTKISALPVLDFNWFSSFFGSITPFSFPLSIGYNIFQSLSITRMTNIYPILLQKIII